MRLRNIVVYINHDNKVINPRGKFQSYMKKVFFYLPEECIHKLHKEVLYPPCTDQKEGTYDHATGRNGIFWLNNPWWKCLHLFPDILPLHMLLKNSQLIPLVPLGYIIHTSLVLLHISIELRIEEFAIIECVFQTDLIQTSHEAILKINQHHY